jgi:signal transduction histidine kinase
MNPEKLFFLLIPVVVAYAPDIRWIWAYVALVFLHDFGYKDHPKLCSDIGAMAPILVATVFRLPPRFTAVLASVVAFRRISAGMVIGQAITTLITNVFVCASLEASCLSHFTLSMEKEKSAQSFLALISHELRTPLHGAFLYTADALLQLSKLKLPRLMKVVQEARSCCSTALSLTEDILAISAIRESALSLSPRSFNIRGIIQAAIEATRPRLRPQVEMVMCVDDEVPAYGFGDGDRLQQIAMNIIVNAIKFTPKGEIQVNCSLASGADAGALERDVDRLVGADFLLCVEVCDTGIGLAEEDIERLKKFEVFTKLERTKAVDVEVCPHSSACFLCAFLALRSYRSARSQRPALVQGTGIGLSLSHQLAVLMGGRGVTIHSEGVGKGSKVAATVALSSTTDEVVEEAGQDGGIAGENSSSSGVSGSVLVVDDNLMCREGFKVAARQAGLTVLKQEVTAENGAVALEIYRQSHKDISFVVMDICMPIMVCIL